MAIPISAIIRSRRRAEGGERRVDGVNLFDYGCVRIFPPQFVHGVVELYRALEAKDKARIAHAFAMWGFTRLTPGTTEAMTVWARFMCGPILDDRVRTAADGVKPSEYGRREIGQVMRALGPRAAACRCRANSCFSSARRSASAARSCASARGSTFIACTRTRSQASTRKTVARRQAGALEAVGLADEANRFVGAT